MPSSKAMASLHIHFVLVAWPYGIPIFVSLECGDEVALGRFEYDLIMLLTPKV